MYTIYHFRDYLVYFICREYLKTEKKENIYILNGTYVQKSRRIGCGQPGEDVCLAPVTPRRQPLKILNTFFSVAPSKFSKTKLVDETTRFQVVFGSPC